MSEREAFAIVPASAQADISHFYSPGVPDWGTTQEVQYYRKVAVIFP